MTLLALENVSKSYGATAALDNISLEISAGKIVGLLGPNGSGKTTLIKLINGLLQPDKGRVLINGLDPSPATKAIVSYLPDTTYLNEEMKVKDALTYFKTFYQDFNLKRAQHLLADLGIDENSRLKKLSKGNKEKVQLILVMSREARLYVLDEPIGSTRPRSSRTTPPPPTRSTPTSWPSTATSSSRDPWAVPTCPAATRYRCSAPCGSWPAPSTRPRSCCPGTVR